MSDPIAQAAEAMNAAPAGTDPTPPAEGAVLAEAPAADVHVPDVSPAPVIGNVLVNSTPTVESPNVAPAVDAGGQDPVGAAPAAGGDLPNVGAASAAPQSGPQADTAQPIAATASDTSADELPRESHLMLLEHKLGIVRAKLVNAERVSLDEFEAIVGHIRAVL